MTDLKQRFSDHVRDVSARAVALLRVLAAETARVRRVLGDLDLLDHLTQRAAVAGAVLAADALLLRASAHCVCVGVLRLQVAEEECGGSAEGIS